MYYEHLPPETDISEQNDNSFADRRGVIKGIYITVTVMLTVIIVLSYIMCAVRFSLFEDIEEDMGASENIILPKLYRNNEVYTNKVNATERMYYPHVQGSYYRVDRIFKSIQDH